MLVLSDLGFGPRPALGNTAGAAAWAQFAHVLQEIGAPLVALTPHSPRLWPASLSQLVTGVYWGASAQEGQEGAREDSEGVELSEDAQRLARALSISPLVSHAQLRKARYALTPSGTSATEAELWFSDLVESRSVQGLVFREDAARRLQVELKERGELAQAAGVAQASRGHLSPALQLEEQLTVGALRGESADALGPVLARALKAMRRPQRAALADWAVQALPRLPLKLRETQVFHDLKHEAASLLALGRTSGATESSVDQPPPVRDWVEAVTPVSGEVFTYTARFSQETLELHPGDQGQASFQIQKTSPRTLVEVSWEENGQRVRQLSALSGREIVSFPCGAAGAQIRSWEGSWSVFSQPLVEIESGQQERRAFDPLHSLTQHLTDRGYHIADPVSDFERAGLLVMKGSGPAILPVTVESAAEKDRRFLLVTVDGALIALLAPAQDSNSATKQFFSELVKDHSWMSRSTFLCVGVRERLHRVAAVVGGLPGKFESWSTQRLMPFIRPQGASARIESSVIRYPQVGAQLVPEHVVRLVDQLEANLTMSSPGRCEQPHGTQRTAVMLSTARRLTWEGDVAVLFFSHRGGQVLSRLEREGEAFGLNLAAPSRKKPASDGGFLSLKSGEFAVLAPDDLRRQRVTSRVSLVVLVDMVLSQRQAVRRSKLSGWKAPQTTMLYFTNVSDKELERRHEKQQGPVLASLSVGEAEEQELLRPVPVERWVGEQSLGRIADHWGSRDSTGARALLVCADAKLAQKALRVLRAYPDWPQSYVGEFPRSGRKEYEPDSSVRIIVSKAGDVLPRARKIDTVYFVGAIKDRFAVSRALALLDASPGSTPLVVDIGADIESDDSPWSHSLVERSE